MLKLDPEDADSDADESREKSKLNSSGILDDSMNQSLNSSRTGHILNEKPNTLSTPNVNNSNIQSSATVVAAVS